MAKYAFFYPENSTLAATIEFDTAKEAIEYWRDKRPSWEAIKPLGKTDEAAFMSPFGAIIVIRELNEGDQ
jgi:hypothetical protein